MVVAILNLLHILLQVRLRNVNVRPANRKLQPGPEPFNRINMTIAINIFAIPVINRFMVITNFRQATIRTKLISMNSASGFDVLCNNWLKCVSADVWDYFCHYLACTFQQPKYNRLIGCAPSSLTSGRFPAYLYRFRQLLHHLSEDFSHPLLPYICGFRGPFSMLFCTLRQVVVQVP